MPYLIDQPSWPVNGSIDRTPIMAKHSGPFARLTDVPWGVMTKFVVRLHAAGLTVVDVKKLLDCPNLLTKSVEAIKSVLSEPTWSNGSYYMPVGGWVDIAPGVQMKSAESTCCRCADDVHVMIRVQQKTCCTTNWAEPFRVHLHPTWTSVASGVQLQRSHRNGVAVRRLQPS